MAGWDDMMRRRVAVLLAGRSLERPARRRVRAAIGHALAFTSWQSLVITERLGRKQAVEMMCDLVEHAG